MSNNNRLLLLCLLFLCACADTDVLPILGETSTDEKTGEISYYKAPEFELKNQQNQQVSDQNFKDKIQIVDFFFTSCPTICPKMTSHLKLVETAFKNDDRVAIISYSIDPKNDTPARLQQYAKQYDIDAKKWSFLTGDSNYIFELSKDYKVRAFDDSTDEEDNIFHDGTFVLVDPQRRIRGYYNGLSKEDTQRLISDIKKLLKTSS